MWSQPSVYGQNRISRKLQEYRQNRISPQLEALQGYGQNRISPQLQGYGQSRTSLQLDTMQGYGQNRTSPQSQTMHGQNGASGPAPGYSGNGQNVVANGYSVNGPHVASNSPPGYGGNGPHVPSNSPPGYGGNGPHVPSNSPPGYGGNGPHVASNSPPGYGGNGPHVPSNSPPGYGGNGPHVPSNSPPGYGGNGPHVASNSPPGYGGNGQNRVSPPISEHQDMEWQLPQQQQSSTSSAMSGVYGQNRTSPQAEAQQLANITMGPLSILPQGPTTSQNSPTTPTTLTTPHTTTTGNPVDFPLTTSQKNTPTTPHPSFTLLPTLPHPPTPFNLAPTTPQNAPTTPHAFPLPTTTTPQNTPTTHHAFPLPTTTPTPQNTPTIPSGNVHGDSTNGSAGRSPSSSSKKADDPDRIKRPMNSFMIWSRTQRRKISAENPKMHNSEISKELGAMWREMTQEEKEPFIDEAKRARAAHQQEHPDYKYRPRRKNIKTANKKNSHSLVQGLVSPGMTPGLRYPTGMYPSHMNGYGMNGYLPMMADANSAAYQQHLSQYGYMYPNQMPASATAAQQYMNHHPSCYPPAVGQMPPYSMGPAQASHTNPAPTSSSSSNSQSPPNGIKQEPTQAFVTTSAPGMMPDSATLAQLMNSYQLDSRSHGSADLGQASALSQQQQQQQQQGMYPQYNLPLQGHPSHGTASGPGADATGQNQFPQL